MITAIISFSLCSGLLLGIYHLLLKGKTLYNFNRYYLLFSLAFSLIVPFITLKTSVPVIDAIRPVEDNIVILPADEQHQLAWQNQLPVHDAAPAAHIVHLGHNYWLYAILGLYMLVALVLLYRFGRNLYLIGRSVKEGEQLRYKGAKLVLTGQSLTPYTFLHYIFMDKAEYANHTIDPAILKHELTHARQLHSVDIILIELLQALCWFNPFILFYRKAIELNHEFIADAAAIGHANNVAGYQYLLLNTVSHSGGLSLTSQFNYLTIKKRLMMMNRSTNAAWAIVAKAATVPVFIAAFVLFCAKAQGFNLPAVAKMIKPVTANTIKEKPHRDTVKKFPPPIITTNYPHTKDGVSDEVLKQYQALVDKYKGGNMAHLQATMTAEDRETMMGIFKKMSRGQQAQQTMGFYYGFPPLAPHVPTQAEIDLWKDPKYCGLWLDDKKVDNSVLDNYKASDFGHAFVSKLYGAAKKNKTYKYQVNVYTVDTYAKMRKQEIADEHKSFMYVRMAAKPKS
jgi:beta-lactamase regulating signal transducer with metallopeptidase domain